MFSFPLKPTTIQKIEGDTSASASASGSGSTTTGIAAFFPTAARTTATDGSILTANTHYFVNAKSSAVSLELPNSGSSSTGDYIHLMFSEDAQFDVVVSVATGEHLALGSLLVVRRTATTSPSVSEVTSTADSKLTIIRAANGDGAAGTTIECYFNGTHWYMSCTVERMGDNTDTTSASSFS